MASREATRGENYWVEGKGFNSLKPLKFSTLKEPLSANRGKMQQGAPQDAPSRPANCTLRDQPRKARWSLGATPRLAGEQVSRVFSESFALRSEPEARMWSGRVFAISPTQLGRGWLLPSWCRSGRLRRQRSMRYARPFRASQVLHPIEQRPAKSKTISQAPSSFRLTTALETTSSGSCCRFPPPDTPRPPICPP